MSVTVVQQNRSILLITMTYKVLILFAVCYIVQGERIALTCDQIRQFVDGHNLNRQSVAMGFIARQPAASKMNYLVWDEELQEKAAKWAENGLFSHNPDRTVLSGRWPLVGENIYYSSMYSPFGSVIPNIQEALNVWFSEWMKYEYEPYTLERGAEVGHYTQMVWANTTKMGCGIGQKRENDFIYSYFVCNYGAAGNWIGEAPYVSQTASGHLQCPEIGGCTKPYGPYC